MGSHFVLMINCDFLFCLKQFQCFETSIYPKSKSFASCLIITYRKNSYVGIYQGQDGLEFLPLGCVGPWPCRFRIFEHSIFLISPVGSYRAMNLLNTSKDRSSLDESIPKPALVQKVHKQICTSKNVYLKAVYTDNFNANTITSAVQEPGYLDISRQIYLGG